MAFEAPGADDDGAGFALGDAPNTFNAATEAAAITARNTYASNNASWLAEYDDAPNLMVQVTWPVSPTDAKFFVRSNDTWVNVTPVITGPEGPKGDKGDTGGATVSAFANNTAYPARSLVYHNDTLFIAKVDVPDTNTQAPVDGSTWQEVGRVFTPSKANLYEAVKAIFKHGLNVLIAADDDENELTISATGNNGGVAASESTEEQARDGTDDATANATRMTPRRTAEAIESLGISRAGLGLARDGNSIGVDEAQFSDSDGGSWYTYGASALPSANREFAISNGDGSTFYSVGNSTFDFSTLPATGRLYITTNQGNHTDGFGVEGSKDLSVLSSGDSLVIQPAAPLSDKVIRLSLSGAGTAFGSGDSAGFWYPFQDLGVDAGFGESDSGAFRFSDSRHPIIQIPTEGVKGGDSRWLRKDGENLTEFEGPPDFIVVEDSSGIKEQAFDDFQKQHANVDTLVRFLSVERQGNNLATPAAGYFSLHTSVDGLVPVTWTGKNARQVSLLQKFLVRGQRLRWSTWGASIHGDVAKSGDTFSFSVKESGSQAAVGQIYDMYMLGRRLLIPQDLEGSETDRYASYTNAFFAAADRRGSICLFNTSSAPTDDTDAIGQPDIADDTTAVFVMSATLRTDRDPNNLVWASAAPAGVIESGDSWEIAIWDDRTNTAKITFTSNGTLVGTGNAAYIWATCSIDEVGDIPDVADRGNYMLVAQDALSSLDIRIPARDVIGAFALSGVEETDATLENSDALVLKDGAIVTIAELFEHHDQFHVGTTAVPGYTYVTGSVNAAGKLTISPPTADATGSYSIQPLNDAHKALLQKIIRAEKVLRYKVSATRYIEFRPGGAPAELFGRLSGTIPDLTSDPSSYQAVGAALTNNLSVSIEIESNIPARDEMAKQVFLGATSNIAGKDGETNQTWLRGSDDENAAWGWPKRRRWTKSGIGTSYATIASNLNDDDWVTVSASATKLNVGSSLGRSLAFRFGDLSAERKILFSTGSTEAGFFQKSGSNLQAKRGSGITALSTTVYAERVTFDNKTI